jgi:predicted RND superfamily exporter protein
MAIVLVYLLIVVNFQSWVDAAIIVAALPAALAGIAWILFITGTTLSVPALTGAIMTMGVATANSILVVAFARQQQDLGMDPTAAALEAGATRIRPVLMTALAMIIGMIPMALGLGEGAEQNAPLGRAVIGGLLFATVSTLFFVPVVFAGVHRRLAQRRTSRATGSQRPPSSRRRARAMTDERSAVTETRASSGDSGVPRRWAGGERASWRSWCLSCSRSARRAPSSAGCPTNRRWKRAPPNAQRSM